MPSAKVRSAGLLRAMLSRNASLSIQSSASPRSSTRHACRGICALACSFRIEGDAGWVETGDATKIECSDNIKPLLRPTESASLALENHMNELVRCIKTRQPTSASAAAAANSHVTCHAAFIAYQRGKRLTWDTTKHEFTNDEVANHMRSRALREPWRI